MLRTEPKKTPVDPSTITSYIKALGYVLINQVDCDCFWNLGEGDDPKQERRYLEEAANQVGLRLRIIFQRKKSRFRLRLVCQKLDGQSKILRFLSTVARPVKRQQIIHFAEISPGSWRTLITPLINDGAVVAKGNTRQRVYGLPWHFSTEDDEP